MRAIILSIKPEHAFQILNGNKVLELRKSVPKGFIGWVYCYVTKGKRFLMHSFDTVYYLHDMPEKYRMKNDLNGTIPFRFWFDDYLTIAQARNAYGDYLNDLYVYDQGGWIDHNCSVLKELCLTVDEVIAYGKGKDTYAVHINNLEIFEKPMHLSDFYKNDNKNVRMRDRPLETILYDGKEIKAVFDDISFSWIIMPNKISRPPRSWQYVWVCGGNK